MTNLKKLYLFSGIAIFCTILILVRIFSLAIEKKDNITNYPKERGIIYDRKMRPIAYNIPAYTIYIDKNKLGEGSPSEISNNVDKLFKYLPQTLEISPLELGKLLNSKNNTVTIKRKLDKKTYQTFLDIKKENNMQSVYGREEYIRSYPDGDLFCHITGYMDKSDTAGYADIEQTYQHLLADYAGGAKSLALTVDRDVQAIVRNELLKTVSRSSIQSATVIIEDVATGAILANYNYPSFDPNNAFAYSSEARNNRSTSSITYFGSTMKIFTILAALQSGVVKMDETFICNGYYAYSDYTRINCDYIHGKVKFEDILKYSCNSAIVQIAERIDKNFFYNYLKNFGFGSKTGIDISEKEWAGIYHPLKKWHEFSRGYIAIGYEMSLTPIQMINSYSTVVNGGYKKTPYVIDKVMDAGGNILVSRTNEKGMSVIPEEYSSIAKFLLKKGVEAGGTGELANIQSIGSIGKTGTAVLDISRKGQTNIVNERYYHSLFIGAIPAENPEVVILVLLNGPRGDAHSGGKLAAPLFRTIALQTIPYLDITDSRIYTVETASINNLLPPINQKEYDIMPNISGMSMRDTLTTLSPIIKNLGIRINIDGEGYVKSQNPPAGTTLSNKQIIDVIFDKTAN